MEPLMIENETSQHHLNFEHTHIVQVPSLPTITEQSVTAAMSKPPEERPKISDIFPENSDISRLYEMQKVPKKIAAEN